MSCPALRGLRVAAFVVGLLAVACGEPEPPIPGSRSAAHVSSEELVGEYLERYFETFPTRATAAGRHDLDDRLERLGPQQRRRWLELNRRTAADLRELLRGREPDEEQRLDLELLLRQAERQVLDFGVADRPGRDPLFWAGRLANATVLLLVRDDLPASERLASAARRAEQIPGLAVTARQALAAADPAAIPAELCRLAARQLSASARFYRQGFAEAAGADTAMRQRMAAAGAIAAPALERLSRFLEGLAGRASGDFRLGDAYSKRFRLATGVEQPVDSVLAEAEAALEAKVDETARLGREAWSELMAGEPPAGDRDLVLALFERVAADRASSVEEFIEDYRSLIRESTEFVRQRRVVTLPEPLTLWVGRSPSFFIGQSVGGVYAAGPWADPDAETLLFLPTPPDSASEEQRDAFFRDFNDHFNRMITPHEIIPGHYLQLKYAARHPRRVRALFGDGVYIEGWGTFCERLMLDLGWGGPLDRLAHLKKQLENIARTIVDIRVHTRGMTRAQVLDFVRGEALQDEQFAGNMWRRAMTTPPQLTYYWLGYRQVMGLYEDVRAARGEVFELRAFNDAMMEMGPVPVRDYRRRLLGRGSPEP